MNFLPLTAEDLPENMGIEEQTQINWTGFKLNSEKFVYEEWRVPLSRIVSLICDLKVKRLYYTCINGFKPKIVIDTCDKWVTTGFKNSMPIWEFLDKMLGGV